MSERQLAPPRAVCYLPDVRAKAPLSTARRAAVAILIAAAAASASPRTAVAHEGGELIPVPRPPAPPGDGAKAEQIIKDIEARAARDPKTAAVVAEPIATAKKSIERGHGALASGDAAHARMLFGLALEWAETARDLERAASAEQVADATAKSASDAATQVERAKALLEETQARRGRAAAELEKAVSEAKDAADAAALAEQQRLEAGKKGGKAPKAEAGKKPAEGKKPAGGKGGKKGSP